MNFYIRRAAPADVNHLLALHVNAVRNISVNYYSLDQLAAWTNRLSHARYLSAINQKILLVACEPSSHRILGFAELDPESGWVNACYVLPDHERQGIGYTLLQQLEYEAMLLNISAINLNASLNACEFYMKAGYIRLQDGMHQFSSGISIPCVLMQKKIT